MDTKDLPSAETPPEGLFELHRDRVHTHVLRLVGDASIAEDLTQEVYLRFNRGWSKLKEQQAIGAWLRTIATNICLDHFRAETSRSKKTVAQVDTDSGSSPEVLDPAPSPEQFSEKSAMGNCIQRTIDRLPTAFKDVLRLHDEEGLTNPEIASMLGISLATVKIRLHRARSTLRCALESECEIGPDEEGNLSCEPR